MKLVAQDRPTSPEAEITLIEKYIFPSVEMLRKLREEKKILAGGPISGTIGIAMIVEAASPLELDGIFESLPVWLLMETSVTPLTTFEDRIRAISPRLERVKARTSSGGRTFASGQDGLSIERKEQHDESSAG